jgi:hypothetical protein
LIDDIQVDILDKLSESFEQNTPVCVKARGKVGEINRMSTIRNTMAEQTLVWEVSKNVLEESQPFVVAQSQTLTDLKALLQFGEQTE